MTSVDDYLSKKLSNGIDYHRAMQLADYVDLAVEAINSYLPGYKFLRTGVQRMPYTLRYGIFVHLSKFALPLVPEATSGHFWLFDTELGTEIRFGGIEEDSFKTYSGYTGDYSTGLILWIVQCLLGEAP